MEHKASAVLTVLQEKGVEFLFHANTLSTSRTFMRSGAVLSRGTVEQRGLKQSPQYSDDIDKQYGIWFDVFLDTVDIHARANRDNQYGPILFVLNLDILLTQSAPPIWVTKKNPTSWVDGEPAADRWFQSIDELRASLDKFAFGQILVLRHIGGVLPLKGNLNRVIIDKLPDGLLTRQVNVESYCRGALMTTALPGLGGRYYNRVCRSRCQCQANYQAMDKARLRERFALW